MKARSVFDISKDWARARDRYGDTEFGKGCLMALKLIEAGVPFVEVGQDNYDSHADNFVCHKANLRVLDPAWSALLDDLHERGRLKDTLVLWMGEVGRTPQIAAGNRLGEILLWELPQRPGAETPPPSRKLTGHTNCINRLIASRDGSKLFSCSHDHSIRIWYLKAATQGQETVALNAVTRQQLIKRRSSRVPAPLEARVQTQPAAAVLSGHRDWIVSLALSRDEKLLVSGNDSGEVLTHEISTGKEVGRWKVKGWVYSLALSPDSKRVFVSERVPLVFDSGRRDGAGIYDRETGRLIQDLSALFKGQYLSGSAYSSPEGPEGGQGFKV